MTGNCPLASIKVPRSPKAAGNRLFAPISESGCTLRGLNSISGARRPPKSATRKILCLRANRGLAQYWASKTRQQRSGFPPRTIPAVAHLPVTGIETSVFAKADNTALKSIRLFDENAPSTFSQTAITGNRLSVASLISCIIRMA